MKIEFFFFAGCPSHGPALERLNGVLDSLALPRGVVVREVTTEEQARELGFIGSPTIRVDGEDIDPPGLEGEPPGLSCRIYRLEDGRISPLPSESMIRRAIMERKSTLDRTDDLKPE